MKKFYLSALFLFCISLPVICQTVDPTFSIPLFSGMSTIYATHRFSNDKLLIAGDFVGIGATPRIGKLVMLNADGTVDNSFNVGTGFSGGRIFSIAVQPVDGKIILAGVFTEYNGVAINGILRLNTDGSLDPTFNPGTGPSVPGVTPPFIHSVVIQDDGKIVAAGTFTSFNSIPKIGIVRLNIDGSIDQSYAANITFASSYFPSCLLLQQDGKILYSAGIAKVNGTPTTFLVRLNSDGSLDAPFNSAIGTGVGTAFSTNIRELALQSDGKILLTGNFSSVNSVNFNKLARLNTDGSVDVGFNSDAGFAGGNYPSTLLVMPDNSIIVGGTFLGPAPRLVRLTANGVYDNTFNVGLGAENFLSSGNADVSCLIRQSDGKIVFAGSFSRFNNQPCISLARVSATGAFDATYNPKPAGVATIKGVLPTPDGKVYVAGDFLYMNGVETKLGLVRLNTDGTRDAGFNVSGMNTSSNNIRGSAETVAFDSNGKLLVGGDYRIVVGAAFFSGFGKFNTDGSFDNTWTGFTGLQTNYTEDGVNDIAVQADGKIIIGGSFVKVNGVDLKHFARLNVNGTLDNTFNTTNDFTDQILNFDIRPSDGKIVFALWPFGGGLIIPRIGTANANGSRDAAFNINSKFNGSYLHKAIFNQSGKILVGGDFTQYDGQTVNRIIKLDDAGVRDASFVVSEPMTGYSVRELFQLNSGLILLGKAYSSNSTGTPKNYFDVINDNGTIVSENLEVDGEVYQIAPTTSSIYMCGKITKVGSTSVYSLVRLTNPPAPASSPSALQLSTNYDPRRNILTWTDNTTTEAGFEIQRSITSNSGFTKVGVAAPNATTFTDVTGLVASTQYYYRVKASNINGETGFSNEATITTLPDPPIAPSALLVGANTNSTIEIKWKDNSTNETGFEIFRSTPANPDYVQVGTANANTTTYIDAGLTIGITYFYKVRAINSGGASSFTTAGSDVILGLGENEDNQVTAYPNPATDQLIIENASTERATIDCFNNVGGRMLSGQQIDSSSSLNLAISSWPKGIYYVSVKRSSRIQILKVLKF